MKPGLRILSVTALLSAGCAGEELPAALAQQSAPITYASTTTDCPGSLYGPITVTVHHNGSVIAGAGVCKLFDGNFNTNEFAVIAGNGTARLKIDLQFPGKRRLSGVRTEVGGYSDLPAGYSYRVGAFCDEEAVDFPQYHSYTDKKVSLGFNAPCTTDRISIGFSRDHADGIEHVTEIQPIFADGTQPVSGDHIAFLEHEAVLSCNPSERLSTADILGTTGTSVGKVHLFRALCTRATGGSLYVYSARSNSTVGAPLDMSVMSAYVRLTESSGAASMSAPSIVTLQNPAGSALKSNVWARTADQTAVKVAACARFYPSNASNQAQASASGCTADHLLP